jgi:hypothetical protein
MEGTGAYFHVVWLLYYAALICPVSIQLENYILEIHAYSSNKSLKGPLRRFFLSVIESND